MNVFFLKKSCKRLQMRDNKDFFTFSIFVHEGIAVFIKWFFIVLLEIVHYYFLYITSNLLKYICVLRENCLLL